VRRGLTWLATGIDRLRIAGWSMYLPNPPRAPCAARCVGPRLRLG